MDTSNLIGQFLDRRDLKVASVEGKAAKGAIVTVTYNTKEKGPVTAQYPIAYVVAEKEGKTLVLLGQKVNGGSTSARW